MCCETCRTKFYDILSLRIYVSYHTHTRTHMHAHPVHVECHFFDVEHFGLPCRKRMVVCLRSYANWIYKQKSVFVCIDANCTVYIVYTRMSTYNSKCSVIFFRKVYSVCECRENITIYQYCMELSIWPMTMPHRRWLKERRNSASQMIYVWQFCARHCVSMRTTSISRCNVYAGHLIARVVNSTMELDVTCPPWPC